MISHKKISPFTIKGIKTIQHKLIKTLTRKRGSEPRNPINKNIIKREHTGKNFLIINEDKNKDLNTNMEFSPKKIIENSSPPYSTLKPETISDSPSAKSNGERLFSIIKLTNNKIKIT